MLNPALNQLFAASNFTLEITNDGSPTLRLITTQESMHHFDGAASETWYVYGLILEQALKLINKSPRPAFKMASVGLGLGYVELTWALLLHHPLIKSINIDWTLDSFEISDELRKSFREWVSNVNTRTHEVYDLALLKLQAASQLQHDSLSDVKNRIQQPGFNFHGDLFTYSENPKWNFICFDAFSKNTDQSLWTEDFLNYFFNRFTAPDCIFTTYAATSVLKKVLAENNFHVVRRLGYSGKRECTLAVRGEFRDGFATFRTF